MKRIAYLSLTVSIFSVFLFCCQNRAEPSAEDDKEKLVLATDTSADTVGRVTGIGGIFFKTENPDSLKNWYADNLRISLNPYGSSFEFRNANSPDDINYLLWAPFSENTKYFEPSDKDLMINYRVVNLDALVASLEAKGTMMLDTIANYEYGRFVHFMDPEGNKIELWEPVDSVFTAMGGPTTK